MVVSTSYRYAPLHTFPAAHEDVRDVAEYLIQNAERLWGADPAVFTVSGFSVGGNLAFAVAQELSASGGVKGLVSFEGVVCSLDFSCVLICLIWIGTAIEYFG